MIYNEVMYTTVSSGNVSNSTMSLMEPMKMIDGHQVMCKLAEDGKKIKVGAPLGPGEIAGERMA